MNEAVESGWRITVDTGGTFTDVVVADAAGHFTIGKALTTPDRIFVGLKAALEAAASDIELSVAEIFSRTDIFIYGTTRATNAIVTNNIAKTAFVTTEGFPDVLVLREGGKFNPHDFSQPFPKPYIPRRHTFEIEERIGSQGEIVTPLNEKQLDDIVTQLSRHDFEACAVSLLWSVANPEHELKIGAALSERLPKIPFTLSHRLNPILREYRRASSVAIDASIKPLMQTHLRDLQSDLRGEGYQGEILVSTTIGGSLDIDSVIDRPINTVRSGPAMGPVAGRQYARLEASEHDVLVVDTGGTTFDVSLVRDGRISVTQETWLGARFTGHMLGVPAVDARSVGAGGGSIAWVDDANLLHVGPQSAGAVPGPACYGNGGTEPTVTDAAVVLGYVDPDYFLGGRMTLDVAAAKTAVARVADGLNISVEEAAFSIFAVSNETMINAIKDITVSEGSNPSEAVIVAGGGAAGLSIVPIADELKCQGVIVPRTASVLSACGMQFSDIQVEERAIEPVRSDEFDRDAVNRALNDIDERLQVFAAKLAERGFTEVTKQYRVDAHYGAQIWDISVDLGVERLNSDQDVADLCEAFHAAHRRIYNVDDRGSPIEFVNWTGRLAVSLPQSSSSSGAAETVAVNKAGTREVWFDVKAPRNATICRGDSINIDETIEGPAIIEEATTTLVLPPGTNARLTGAGSYYVSLS
ncbi:MAG: hydantoinase/oxoprolinase family protein [Pseudomonadota bacterium]